MEYFDTFNEEGVFMSSEDEKDIHYKGLWHKVIRVWLYDVEGNIYLRRRKEDKKLDCINELHLLSSESVPSCFDRGMFEKLGIHFPASANIEQAYMRKIKKHKVFSDNSEMKDNYFLCDYIGEFDKNTNFFIFSNDTEGLIKCSAKGVLGLLSTRTGEVVSYDVQPSGKSSESKKFVTIQDIYEDFNEDTYTKYSHVINQIETNAQKVKKQLREEEKMRKLVQKDTFEEESFESHADDNDGDFIY
ncbi:MAG: hypothetical protein IKB06_04315 [Clostridia bacterium]|nr:hypothetical protein [Clostridia bacterium]